MRLSIIILAVLLTANVQAEDVITTWLNSHTPTNSPFNSTKWTASDWDQVAFSQWQEATSGTKLGGAVPVTAQDALGAEAYINRARLVKRLRFDLEGTIRAEVEKHLGKVKP